MNKNLRTLALLCFVLFVAASVTAAMNCEAARPGASGLEAFPTITFNETKYAKACFNFSWGHDKTAGDFNNYVVRTTGDVTTSDFNWTEKSYDVCTVEPGDTVTIFVRAHDGNEIGRWCGFDNNTTMGSASVTQAASFFVYMLMAAFAGIVGIIILLALAVYVIKSFGITKMVLKK